MNSFLIFAAFVSMILAPCLVAMFTVPGEASEQ